MTAIISAVFGLIELVLGFRFMFLFLGANPSAPFVDWIYDVSTPFVTPFAGILGQPVVAPVGTVVNSIFDASTLIAFVVYASIGGLLIAFTRGR
ncbi:MAG TPA: hypothetical protein VFZ48_00415 [Candidatus Saccharimonadales bacterium]